MTRHTHTIDFAARLSCDLCGEDHVELREIHRHAPVNSIWCAACFGHPDEAEFTDFPLAQEAKTNA